MVHFNGKKKKVKTKMMKQLPDDIKFGNVNQHNIYEDYKKSKEIKETDVFDKKKSKKPKKVPGKPRLMPDKTKSTNTYS
mgnify:CR=1 FL=1|tara:strand:+ start:3381 stop:3617 length:237 start_codon:yes stop_codon:yes gene_type:complete